MVQDAISFWNLGILPECVDSGIDAWEFHTLGGGQLNSGRYSTEKQGLSTWHA